MYYRELRKDFEVRIREAETSLEVALGDLQVTSSLDEEQPGQAGNELLMCDWFLELLSLKLYIDVPAEI